MIYFFVTVQIVFGILTPGFLLLGMWLGKAFVEARAESIKYERYKRENSANRWHLHRHETCNNHEFVVLVFRNSETGDVLKIGCERAKLIGASIK